MFEILPMKTPGCRESLRVDTRALSQIARVTIRQAYYDLADGAPNDPAEYLRWRERKAARETPSRSAKRMSKLTGFSFQTIYSQIRLGAPHEDSSQYLEWRLKKGYKISTLHQIAIAVGVSQGCVHGHIVNGAPSCVAAFAYYAKLHIKKKCFACGCLFVPKSGTQQTCAKIECSKTLESLTRAIDSFIARTQTVEKEILARSEFKCRICGCTDHPKGEARKTIYCSDRCCQIAYNRRRSERMRSTKPEDIQFKLAKRLRNRLREMLKGCKKESAMKLLGCSIEDFRIHIQSMFSKGMAWNNYGSWEIDHIQPCASFDLTNEYQRKICFHYSNMRPLWKLANRKKGDKIVFSQLGLPI